MENIRTYRIPPCKDGIVIFDTLAVLTVAGVIAYNINDGVFLSWWFIIFLFGMLLGIITHYITDTPTKLNQHLGLQ